MIAKWKEHFDFRTDFLNYSKIMINIYASDKTEEEMLDDGSGLILKRMYASYLSQNLICPDEFKLFYNTSPIGLYTEDYLLDILGILSQHYPLAVMTPNPTYDAMLIKYLSNDTEYYDFGLVFIDISDMINFNDLLKGMNHIKQKLFNQFIDIYNRKGSDGILERTELFESYKNFKLVRINNSFSVSIKTIIKEFSTIEYKLAYNALVNINQKY